MSKNKRRYDNVKYDTLPEAERGRLKIGDKVRRTPITFGEEDAPQHMGQHRAQRKKSYTGRIVYIHPDRRFHIVEFSVPGGTIRESFNRA